MSNNSARNWRLRMLDRTNTHPYTMVVPVDVFGTDRGLEDEDWPEISGAVLREIWNHEKEVVDSGNTLELRKRLESRENQILETTSMLKVREEKHRYARLAQELIQEDIDQFGKAASVGDIISQNEDEMKERGWKWRFRPGERALNAQEEGIDALKQAALIGTVEFRTPQPVLDERGIEDLHKMTYRCAPGTSLNRARTWFSDVATRHGKGAERLERDINLLEFQLNVTRNVLYQVDLYGFVPEIIEEDISGEYSQGESRNETQRHDNSGSDSEHSKLFDTFWYTFDEIFNRQREAKNFMAKITPAVAQRLREDNDFVQAAGVRTRLIEKILPRLRKKHSDLSIPQGVDLEEWRAMEEDLDTVLTEWEAS